MADTSYGPKVYRKQGGNELVVASGGSVNFETGGLLKIAGSSIMTGLTALVGLVAGQGAASKIPLLDSGGSITIPGIVGLSRQTLAAAGSSQADAAVITKQITVVTGADGTKGVALPAAAATGGPFWVVNADASNPLPVYPVNGGDDAINSLGANNPFNLEGGQAALFVPTSATQYYCAGVASAVVATIAVNPFELRQAAAFKDALPDAPNGTTLGLADAAGSVVTGTTTNSGATASASETAAFQIALPKDYQAGQAITLRARAKVSVDRNTAQTIDAVVKKVGTDGTLGADICATAAQSITTSYADYDFTITPTGLVAGDILNVVLTLATDDTGGGSNGFPTLSQVSLRPTVVG